MVEGPFPNVVCISIPLAIVVASNTPVWSWATTLILSPAGTTEFKMLVRYVLEPTLKAELRSAKVPSLLSTTFLDP